MTNPEPKDYNPDAPYPGGTPPVVEQPNVHHELIDEDIEGQIMNCSCGLVVSGPNYKFVMEEHIMNENDWEE